MKRRLFLFVFSLNFDIFHSCSKKQDHYSLMNNKHNDITKYTPPRRILKLLSSNFLVGGWLFFQKVKNP